MSQDNVIEAVVSDVSRAFAKVINASTEFAMAMIELRIQRLREAARRDEEQARAAREQTRMHHQADSAVWRAAMRPQWWRDAGAEDIGRVWRAASMWQHVDPRAAEARQVVIDRLADRGVRVDPAAPSQPSPDDAAWLSDALDRAAADRSARAAADRAARAAAGDAERGRARPGREQSAMPGDGPTVIDGEAGEAPATEQPRRSAQEREQRAAEHVRSAWSPERAERVIGCKAWGALVTQLDQLEEHGHDVEALLRGVPAFVDKAHTPAAFAYRSIDDRLDGLVDLGTQHRGGDVAEQSNEARSGAAEQPEAGQGAGEPVPDPFGPAVAIDYEGRGRELVGGADPEQVRAAGIAYWQQDKDSATSRFPGQPHQAWSAVGYAESQIKLWRESGAPLEMLGAETASGAAWIQQRVGRNTGGVAAETAAPAPTVSQATAESSEATTAAQVAAQAYPITTKAAVAGAAQEAQNGAAGVSTGGPAGTRPATARPAPQPTRDEPKGR
jgi:hypothetical protein